jgi:glycosyltransferase involved in cell wall biosynthesis
MKAKLCIITKNEVETLPRLVESVLPLIDSWVICDTGSTDGTPELATQLLYPLPGKLHRHEWVNFGHNRNLLLRASDGYSWRLLLDADMTVAGWLPADEEVAEWDGLLLTYTGTTQYAQCLLIDGSKEWHYVGVTHEYIHRDGARMTPWPHLRVTHHGDGGSRSDKLERDLVLLTQEHDDPRTTFYLAQTYRDLGHLNAAAESYRARAGMGGWDEEVYIAWLEAGRAWCKIHDRFSWPKAVECFTRAWQSRPQRMEAVYELASGYRTRELYYAAHQFARLGVPARQRAIPNDLLFVEPWVWRWGLLFEYSITSYWTSQYRESVAACEALLERSDLPDVYRKQTESNLTLAKSKVGG